MAVTYTNRKGITYTLCRGETRTGRPRYSFVRNPQGRRVVDALPEGWEISESVNGIVSLVRKRPQKVLPEEVKAVEEAVRRHPKAHNYRVDVKQDRIEVYESMSPDADDLLSDLKRFGLPLAGKEASVRDVLKRSAHFSPVLRFTLQDEETRVYRAERMRFTGGPNHWILLKTGPLAQLAREMIPTLGTDDFFELS